MTRLYLYGMRLRPAGPGAQPSNFAWFIDGDKLKSQYHTIIVYNHELSEDDAKAYDLDYIDTIYL